MHAELKTIPIDLIKQGRYQPRTEFEPGALDDLANSIREIGVVEPIIVRACGDTHYEIIAGERRWRAAGLAQLDSISCLVGKYTDVVCRKIGLIENIQRENLNVMEIAKALQDLMDEELLTQEETASAIGKSRSYVANVIAMLRLPERLQLALRAGDLDFGHGKALMGLAEGDQIDLAQKAVAQGWSVRRIEQAAKSLHNKQGRLTACLKNVDMERYMMEQSEKIGAPLDISKGKQGKYEVKLTFYSLDELDGFFSRIK